MEMLTTKSYSEKVMHAVAVKLQELEMERIPGFLDCPELFRTDFRPEIHGDEDE